MGRRTKGGDIRQSVRAHTDVMDCLSRHGDTLGEDAMAILRAETPYSVGDLNKLLAAMNAANLVSWRVESAKTISLAKRGEGLPIISSPALRDPVIGQRRSSVATISSAGEPSGFKQEPTSVIDVSTASISQWLQAVVDELVRNGPAVDRVSGRARKMLAERLGISPAALTQRLRCPAAEVLLDIDARNKRTYFIGLKNTMQCNLPTGLKLAPSPSSDIPVLTATPESFGDEVDIPIPGDTGIDLLALAVNLQRAAAAISRLSALEDELSQARAVAASATADAESFRVELALTLAERDSVSVELENLAVDHRAKVRELEALRKIYSKMCDLLGAEPVKGTSGVEVATLRAVSE